VLTLYLAGELEQSPLRKTPLKLAPGIASMQMQ
jgi:hypothetical protein